MRTKKEIEELQKAEKFLGAMEKIGNARWLAPTIVLLVGIILAFFLEVFTS